MSDLYSELYTKEYFLQNNICRFCWTKDAAMDCTLKTTLCFKVEYCLNIDLSQDDSEYCPKYVCQNCFHKIEEFHDFKLFCQNANKKLNKILSNDTDILVMVIEEEPPLAIKSEKIEISENYDSSSVENIDCSGGNSESSSTSFVESSINTVDREKSIQNEMCTNKRETSKMLHNLQNSEPNPKSINQRSLDSNRKSCIKTRHSKRLQQPETTADNKCRTTKNCLKVSYVRKKCSTYCNICSENFYNKYAFIKHNSEAHGIEEDGKFKCFGCGKLYGTRKARLGHESHFCKDLENGYKCPLCNRYLPRRGMYEKHMRAHRLNKVIDTPEDSIFKCSKCMEQFTKKMDWKTHMEVHTPKKIYVCETCGKAFSRLDYLNKHNVTHTGDRRYVCPHCGFRTTQKNNLTIHIRKHTDERPYPCDLCPQRCVSSSNLRAHRRRHLGLNSFQCSICPKKFGYKLSLKEHIEITHERSQSHPCPHCGSVYARKKGLKRHLQNKHNINPKEIKTNSTENTTVVLYEDKIQVTKRNVTENTNTTTVVLYEDEIQGTYLNVNCANGKETHSNEDDLNVTKNTVQVLYMET